LFLLIVLWPQAIRSFARMFRKSPFAGIIRPEYYIAELLIWSHKAAESMLNLTKAYDWRVSQWSAFSTALITATLAFISAVVLEYFKDTVNTNVELKLRVALLGIVASILVYLMSQKRITLLKEQFLRVCTLLQRREG
jgi:hypothetical protein